MEQEVTGPEIVQNANEVHFLRPFCGRRGPGGHSAIGQQKSTVWCESNPRLQCGGGYFC